MELAKQMTELVAFVDAALTDGANRDHCAVCNLTADRYNLWDDEERFPLWLSFVVQGQMRELGIER